MKYSKQIVFAYIKNYKGIVRDFNLNFLPEVQFHFDKESNKLTAYETNFPKEFFPKGVSSISAIVGTNGCGKSTVLNWILERVISGSSVKELGGIIAIMQEDDNENKVITVYHDIDISDNFEGFPYTVIPEDIRGSESKDLNMRINIPLVFGVEHFDILNSAKPSDKELTGQKNISERFLLTYDLEKYRNLAAGYNQFSIGEYFSAFQIQNNLRICLLLLDPRFRMIDGSQEKLKTDIKLPPFIVFAPSIASEQNVNNRIKQLEDTIKHLSKKQQKYTRRELFFLRNAQKASIEINLDNADMPKGYTLHLFLRASLFSLFYRLYSMPETTPSFSFSMKESIEKLFQPQTHKSSYKDVFEWIDEYMDIFDSKAKQAKEEKIPTHSLEYCRKFLKELRDTLLFISEKTNWEDGSPYINVQTTLFNNPNIQEELESMMKSDIFVTERFFDIFYSHDKHSISTISDGERSLLNLFSRIRDAWYNFNTNDKSLPSLLILDEAEVGFHPEWQRRFVDRLSNFMSLLAPEEFPVQIIYTTHSPITLSDMPSVCSNMIDVENGISFSLGPKDKPLTFGANIFDIYGESFFMRNGLIGEFAVRKIQAIGEEIESHIKNNTIPDSHKLEDLEQRIGIIGDERIKSYLFSRLERIDPRIEIQLLQERIARLTKTMGNEEN